MAEYRQILVNIGVVVNAPLDDELMNRRMDAVSNILHEAANKLAAENSDCFPTKVATYHYLGEGWENALKCTRCGCWASDGDKPNVIDGIDLGFYVDGTFFCTQCAYAVDETWFSRRTKPL